MCGRYTLITSQNLFSRFEIENIGDLPEMTSEYNVSPGKIMPTVTKNSPNKMIMMKWGLIPSWAKDPKIGYKMINARSESVTEKPMYKKLVDSQRCLVPASGFYEWKKVDKEKIPYYFKHKSEEHISFAGLFDEWVDAEGKSIKTFTIITTGADNIMKDIHERMPLILSKQNESLWLNKDTEIKVIKNLLKNNDDSHLIKYQVSQKVNNPKENSPDLNKPV